MTITTVQKNALSEAGYVLWPDFMSPELLHELRARVSELYDSEGDRAGAEFKRERGSRRLANLVNKADIFQDVIAEPRVLELVCEILGADFKLSSLNARAADPQNDPQPLHCDMGAVPDDRGYWVCNVVWMLDDFTRQNGGLRVVPGSHRSGKLPQDASHAPHTDEVAVTGQAGSIIVMNAHLWHGGMANSTSAPRVALHAFYCRRDKPQQQYQKQLLDVDLQASLSPALRDLLALDDSLNDEISSAPATRSGFLR